MLAEIRAGLTQLSDGTVAPARASRIGAEVVGDGQGRYYEAASRGNVFSAGLTAWTSTVAAGNILLAAAAASTQFAVWNPAGSGKNLSLLKFGVYPISGTAPIPAVFHSATLTAPSIATSVAATYGWFGCNNVGMAAASVASGWQFSLAYGRPRYWRFALRRLSVLVFISCRAPRTGLDRRGRVRTY